MNQFVQAKQVYTLKKPHSFIGLSLPALWALFMLRFSGSLFGSTAFFVSPQGNDANSGSAGQPFASVEKARDTIRELKGQGVLKGGVTVWLEAGTYVRERSFELNAADSGTADWPITYRSHPGQSVRWLGGRVLPAFKPVSDEETKKRLPEAARDKVVELDLFALGLKDFGQLRSRGFGRPLTPAHAELFFDGVPMTLARWPNEGAWETIAGFPEAAGQGDEHGGKIGDLKSGFYYAGDHPQTWRASTNLWVHGYWAWDWANSYERIASIDLTSRLVKTVAPYGQYGFRKGQRFYFLNVLEELDQPGEYYIDSARGRLYFWPPKPVEGGEAILSSLEAPMIALQEVSHVAFHGLVLEGTRGTAIQIHGGTDNRVEACVVRLIGSQGVVIDGGQEHIINACDIENTGDGGVSMSGGNRQTLTPGRHQVENCHFQKQGRWSKCYVPAIGISGVGLSARHNLIHDHPHCAILFGGNDHCIEYNEIHHVALETGDVGAIYAGRDYTYRGNAIRYNFIHHTGGVGMGSMGVYMDDCVSGTEVFGNIFYQVHWAMFIGGGRDHHVENNIFVDCDPAVRADARGLDASPVWRGMVNETMRHSLFAMPLALYRERYPAMRSLDRYYGPPGGPAIEDAAFTGVPPEGNLIRCNLCAGKWLELAWGAKPECFEVRDNYVGPDAGFMAPDQMDFRLKSDSPAWKLGFQPIPTERIGLQMDPLRKELIELRKNAR